MNNFRNRQHFHQKWRLLSICIAIGVILGLLLTWRKSGEADSPGPRLAFDLIEAPHGDTNAFLVRDVGGRIEWRAIADGSLLARCDLRAELYAAGYISDDEKKQVYVLGSPYDQHISDRTISLWTLSESLQNVSRHLIDEPSSGTLALSFSEQRIVAIQSRTDENEEAGEPNELWYSNRLPSLALTMAQHAFPKGVNGVNAATFLDDDTFVAAVTVGKPGEDTGDGELLFFQTDSEDPSARIAVDKRDPKLFFRLFVTPDGKQLVAVSKFVGHFVDAESRKLVRQVQWKKPLDGLPVEVAYGTVISADSTIHVIDAVSGETLANLGLDNAARYAAAAKLANASKYQERVDAWFAAGRLSFQSAIVCENGDKLIAVTGDGYCYIWDFEKGKIRDDEEPILKFRCFEH